MSDDADDASYKVFSTLPEIPEEVIQQLIDRHYKKVESKRHASLGPQYKQWAEYERKHGNKVSDDDIVRAIAINDAIMDFASTQLCNIAEGLRSSAPMRDNLNIVREYVAFRSLMHAAVRSFLRLYDRIDGDDNRESRIDSARIIFAECRDCINDHFGMSIIDDIVFAAVNEFYPLHR